MPRRRRKDVIPARIPMLKVRPGMVRLRDTPHASTIEDRIIDVIKHNGNGTQHIFYTVMTERFNDRVGTGGLHYGARERITVIKEAT